MSTSTIFDTLAQQDTQRVQHDQTTQPTDVFDQIAKKDAPAKPSGPSIGPQSNVNEGIVAGVNAALPKETQPLTMPLVKGLIAVHDKLRDVENLTQEGREAHPVQAAVGDLANRIEGLLTGNETHPEAGIGTGKYGMLTNPVTGSLLPGAEGKPALAAGVEGATNLVKSGVQAGKELLTGSKAAEEGPGIVKQAIQGKNVAQQPAQTAMREGAATSAADAGVAAKATEGAPIRIVMQKPIEAAAKVERGLYDTVNKAAETDMKDLFDHREDLLNALDDPTNVANRTALSDELATTEKAIKVHSDLAASKGVSMDTLNQAKAATQQRYAMQDLEQKLFNNESVVSGNVAHGSSESINVDSAIRQVENLDKPSKFAPRGSPTRLQQALGVDGAQKLKQGLYDAQKAGQSALKIQQIAKWVGGVLGVGAIGGAAKHVIP